MLDKVKHLLNLDEQRIILLGGISGAGKSTLAKEFEKVGYKIICPDTYRSIISKTKEGRENWTEAMHESDQTVSEEAWNMAYKDAIRFVQNGESIVFDAMLHTPKARRRLFAQLDKLKVDYYAIYNEVTLKTAIQRNEERERRGGRRVPDFIIEEKWRAQVLPLKEEGFKEVIIIHNDLKPIPFIDKVAREEIVNSIIENPRKAVEDMYNDNTLQFIFPSLYKCWNVKQENIHHTLLLHEHLIKSAEIVEHRDAITVISTLLHDVGKPKTKEFFVEIIADNPYGFKIGEKLVAVRDNKVAVTVKTKSYQSENLTHSTILLPLNIIEKDYNAHFYDHEKVGAILARRDLISLGFDEQFANEVYKNILYHMDLPYKMSSKKSLRRLIRKVGKERINTLLTIRKADKLSSSFDEEFIENYEKIKQQIFEIIEKEKL